MNDIPHELILIDSKLSDIEKALESFFSLHLTTPD